MENIFKKSLKKIGLRYKKMCNHPLTRNAVFMAMYRYFSFNIIQTVAPKDRVYNWIRGLKLSLTIGDAGLVGNIYYKLMDYEESMFLIDNLKKDDLFIDVGANLGHYSLLASGICKANSIAFEPITKTYNKLIKNIELNNLSSKIHVFKYGVGEEDGILNFTTNKTVMNGVTDKEGENVTQVKVVTLDSVLKTKEPVFIKMDVEGFEYKALKGATETLRKPSLKYLMVEFNDSGNKYGFKDQDVYEIITNFGFAPISYDVEYKEIKKLKSFNKDKFNTLFIREKNA